MTKLADISVKKFIQQLSNDAPYPGGGSASCLSAALGIALAKMVAGITLKRKHSKPLESKIKVLNLLEKAAIKGIDDDVKEYKKVVAAYALKKTRKDRAQRIQKSLYGAYISQRDFATILLEARKIQKSMEIIVSGSIRSDLVLSGEFLGAAFKGAFHTAKINVDYFSDAKLKKKESEKLLSLKKRYEQL